MCIRDSSLIPLAMWAFLIAGSVLWAGAMVLVRSASR